MGPVGVLVVGFPGTEDLTAKLTQLAELNKSGVLTDEEFAAAKAKLLS